MTKRYEIQVLIGDKDHRLEYNDIASARMAFTAITATIEGAEEVSLHDLTDSTTIETWMPEAVEDRT